MSTSTITNPFRKSKFSELHGVLNCVQVGAGGGSALVRDTKEEGDPGRTTLQVGGGAWEKFLAQVR